MTEAEQGHLSVAPDLQLFWDCTSEAILLGGSLALIGGFEKKFLVFPLALTCSRMTLEIGQAERYDQELAREVWEHELSPQREVEEFCEYAQGLGVSKNEAESIGELMVQIPALSVPYHLFTELNIVKPPGYGHVLKRTLIAGCGYTLGGLIGGVTGISGVCLANWATQLMAADKTKASFSVTSLLSGAVAITALNAVVSYFQHSFLNRPKRLRRFQSKAALLSGTALVAAAITGAIVQEKSAN